MSSGDDDNSSKVDENSSSKNDDNSSKVDDENSSKNDDNSAKVDDGSSSSKNDDNSSFKVYDDNSTNVDNSVSKIEDNSSSKDESDSTCREEKDCSSKEEQDNSLSKEENSVTEEKGSSPVHEAAKVSNPAKKMRTGHWSQGLVVSMQDPTVVVESDELIAIIKDKYPKAMHHYLVLPKANLSSLKVVKKEHLPLLRHMHKKAVQFSEKLQSTIPFRYGYHAVQSMSHLHLHLISQDFDSPCLKHKKHWNSFTTEYFIDSKDVIKQVQSKGRVQMLEPHIANRMLLQPLRCHVCQEEFKVMPRLKDHIRVHVNK